MLELLRRQGFVEMPGAKGVSAVYLLLWCGEIVYIGKTTNIHSRLGDHWRAMDRGRSTLSYQLRTDGIGFTIKYDQILVKFAKASEIGNLEADLIKYYKPRYNKYVPTNLPDISIDVVAIAHEVGINYVNSSVKGSARPYRRRVA